MAAFPLMADSRSRSTAEGDGHLRGLACRGRIGREGQSRPLEDLDEQVHPTLERGGEPDAEVGEALADQALGRVDEQDRGLEAALRVDQIGFLPGMLEVVARVGLVGDQADQVGGADREIGIDVDAGAAAAVEPVVGGPRLSGHQRDPQVLAVGKAEIGGGLVAEAGDEPLDHARQAIDRHDETRIPGRESVRERGVAGQELPDACRRRLEDRRPGSAVACTRSSA